MRIVLDPGHGGYDPGATGNGLREKDVVLIIARKVATLVESKGIEVIWTRNTDVALGNDETSDLQRRVAVANATNAVLYVSIHCDGYDLASANGSEVCVCALGGEAERCAKIIAPLLSVAGGFINRGVKVENFYVINKTSMPAILIECGFITNSADAQKLKDDLYLDRISQSIAKGICEWAGIKYDVPSTTIPSMPTPLPSVPSYTIVPTGTNITPLNGGVGWIEGLEDRVILHCDEYNYLCIWSNGKVSSHGKNRDSVYLV
jgi:N-acetylmuramoyl-L-alanine amidase